MQRAHRWLWWAVAALALVLLVTGVWLAFNYRPTNAGAIIGRPPSKQSWRTAHQMASQVLIPVVLVLGAVHLVERVRTWPAALVMFVLVVALSFTGYLLPWDQVALRAVTIGTDFKGLIKAAFSDEVTFVLIGGVEIAQVTLRNWFLVHVAVLPLSSAAALLWLRRRAATVDDRTGV